MAVTAERLPRSLVSLEIEVEPERLEASMKKVVNKLSQQVRIPGFRPGKAPREIVERTVGQPVLLQEAIEDLLPGVYNEALEAESIEAIDQPQIELKSTEPLVVQATVPVRPTIEIGAYQALRVPREEASAGDAEIDEAMTDLRRRYATLEPVDRPVEWNDTVRIDMSVSVEGQEEPHVEEGAEFAVTEGGIVSLPGFLDRLIGLERGGPHEFSFDLPEDYQAEELAGKTANYSVQLLEVKQEILPELDDDFAVSLDEEGIGNLEELQSRVSEGVQAQIETVHEMNYREEVVDLLLATAEIDYPEVLVEREIDRLVDEQSQHAAHEREDFERWLQAIGRTEDEVRDSLREQADLIVRRGLALAEFANREEIGASDEEIGERIDEMVEQASAGTTDLEQRARVRAMFDTEQMRASLAERMVTERALERLIEIASQEDEEIEPRSPRRRGRRRRGSRAGADDEGEGSDEPSAEAEAEEASGDESGEESSDEDSES